MRKLIKMLNKYKSIKTIYVVVCEGADDEVADVLIATHEIEDALDFVSGRQKFNNEDIMHINQVELL
jgi:hypothetical protein